MSPSPRRWGQAPTGTPGTLRTCRAPALLLGSLRGAPALAGTAPHGTDGRTHGVGRVALELHTCDGVRELRNLAQYPLLLGADRGGEPRGLLVSCVAGESLKRRVGRDLERRAPVRDNSASDWLIKTPSSSFAGKTARALNAKLAAVARSRAFGPAGRDLTRTRRRATRRSDKAECLPSAQSRSVPGHGPHAARYEEARRASEHAGRGLVSRGALEARG